MYVEKERERERERERLTFDTRTIRVIVSSYVGRIKFLAPEHIHIYEVYI